MSCADTFRMLNGYSEVCSFAVLGNIVSVFAVLWFVRPLWTQIMLIKISENITADFSSYFSRRFKEEETEAQTKCS